MDMIDMITNHTKYQQNTQEHVICHSIVRVYSEMSVSLTSGTSVASKAPW